MSLTEDIERYITLGLEDGAKENPEFLALADRLAEIERERRKNDPAVILDEIRKALTDACEAAVPEGFAGCWRSSVEHDGMMNRVYMDVFFRLTRVPVWPRPRTFAWSDSPFPSHIHIREIPEQQWRAYWDDIRRWRDEHGEKLIRGWAGELASALRKHIEAHKP